jgi:hypothetical protein
MSKYHIFFFLIIKSEKIRKCTHRKSDRDYSTVVRNVKCLALSFKIWKVLKKTGGLRIMKLRLIHVQMNLFAAGVLGDSLGALRDGVLGQLTRQQETNSGLDFARRDGRATVQLRQTASLAGDSLKDIVHKRVHDAHCL